METHITDGLSAGLEAFFDNDSGTFQSCTGFLHDVDQAKKCAAVCKKIIDQEYVIFRTKEFLGKDYIINFLVCKGFYLGGIHFTVKVYTLCFLCKYNRYVEILCRNAGNTETGSLDGKDLGDWTVVKTFLEFLADLVDQVNIHLMIQEAVHF